MKRSRTFVIASLALAALAMPAAANSAGKVLVVKPDEFQNLPGVTSAPLNEKPLYECHTVIRKADKIGSIDYFGDSGMPVLAYRCERDGLVYEGTRPPMSWKWAPGVNPQTLPK